MKCNEKEKNRQSEEKQENERGRGKEENDDAGRRILRVRET